MEPRSLEISKRRFVQQLRLSKLVKFITGLGNYTKIHRKTLGSIKKATDFCCLVSKIYCRDMTRLIGIVHKFTAGDRKKKFKSRKFKPPGNNFRPFNDIKGLKAQILNFVLFHC
jgi:hypothetical protein